MRSEYQPFPAHPVPPSSREVGRGSAEPHLRPKTYGLHGENVARMSDRLARLSSAGPATTGTVWGGGGDEIDQNRKLQLSLLSDMRRIRRIYRLPARPLIRPLPEVAGTLRRNTEHTQHTISTQIPRSGSLERPRRPRRGKRGGHTHLRWCKQLPVPIRCYRNNVLCFITKTETGTLSLRFAVSLQGVGKGKGGRGGYAGVSAEKSGAVKCQQTAQHADLPSFTHTPHVPSPGQTEGQYLLDRGGWG